MVDAESALFKAKSAYFKCCQAGVKLREDLSTAQSTLDESQATLVAAAAAPPPSTNGGASSAVATTATSAVSASTDSGLDGSASASSASAASSAFVPPSPVDPGLMNTVVKQKAKVERLEKQLGDNDKKVSLCLNSCHYPLLLFMILPPNVTLEVKR